MYRKAVNSFTTIFLWALCFLFIFIATHEIKSQDTTSIVRKNIIKINFVPVIPAISGQSQQWIGIEYEWIKNSKLSFAFLSNIGLFEDYSYKKYYDYFNQHQGFSYTQKDIKTKGYHMIPSIRYHFLTSKKKSVQGMYLGGNLDFNQYFKKLSSHNSETDESTTSKLNTTRMGLGISMGAQYLAFSRLSLEVNISFFVEAFEVTSDINQLATPPINAFWKSDTDVFWSTVQIMIGYAFGRGKRENIKRAK